MIFQVITRWLSGRTAHQNGYNLQVTSGPAPMFHLSVSWYQAKNTIFISIAYYLPLQIEAKTNTSLQPQWSKGNALVKTHLF
jgi:hypothetical protein